MAEDEIIDAVSGQVGQFETVTQLLASSPSLQIAFTILIVGIIGIVIAYRGLSNWTKSQKFSYTRPHVSRFVRVAILPFFAIALISSTNAYIQTFELFTDSETTDALSSDTLTANETFAKILNTLNILVIGYTVAHLIPIIITKREKTNLEREDYEEWVSVRGFPDDEGDFFHKLFKWIPPKNAPEDMTDEEFKKYMNTEEGRKYLEGFRTTKGNAVGGYEELVKDPFEEWKKNEREKYEKYFQSCISGKNESGRTLRTGQKTEEIYAIALISSTNAYIQTFELFTDSETTDALSSDTLTANETFAKILNTLNILVIGYTVAHLIPIIITKREKTNLEREDYEEWVSVRGFPDDEGDFFHKLFKWIPPKNAPEDMTDEEFKKYMNTEEGRKYLEGFRTTKGNAVGGYEELVKDPFEEWKKNEREKYEKYFQSCISGKNESGRTLRTGQKTEEIYAIDIWREEKRMNGFEPIIPGTRPAGYAAKKRKDIPKSVTQIIPIGVFAAIVLGVISWWGIDLIVLATATGGFAIGIGLALQETMQNWFAYIMIRKDKIVMEGDRVQLDTGYNGYIHKITSRVTYVRHAMNESYAIIPTRSMINAQIINYSKDLKMVPAIVDVGVSYLNDPKQVASILVKVGKRTMLEVIDSKGRHLVVQKRCPYLTENKPSCGCDAGLHVVICHNSHTFNDQRSDN